MDGAGLITEIAAPKDDSDFWSRNLHVMAPATVHIVFLTIVPAHNLTCLIKAERNNWCNMGLKLSHCTNHSRSMLIHRETTGELLTLLSGYPFVTILGLRQAVKKLWRRARSRSTATQNWKIQKHGTLPKTTRKHTLRNLRER